MNTVADLLDRARQCRNLSTDAELAATLGVSRQAVNSWRQGKTSPSSQHVAAMARLCREDVGRWLAVLKAA